MGKQSMFKRGYGAVQEEKTRIDKARENAGNKLWTFFLSRDGDEAVIRFLNEEPITFDAHVIMEGRNYNTYVCPAKSGASCRFCDSGDKTVFHGAYLIIDKREVEYTNRSTGKKETHKAQLRLYLPKTTVMSQLDRLSSKYGLTKRDYEITRSGVDTKTAYMLVPLDPTKITREEVANLMPEKMREKYDGSQDSVMDIIEEQLTMLMVDSRAQNNDEEDEEETSRDSVIDLDDDEETETNETKKGLKSPQTMFKKNKTKDIV